MNQLTLVPPPTPRPALAAVPSTAPARSNGGGG